MRAEAPSEMGEQWSRRIGSATMVEFMTSSTANSLRKWAYSFPMAW